MQKLRILFLGDEQVGKTSIIRCYVTQSFPSDVPTCNPPISIPPELSFSKASLTIIDSYCIFYLDRRGQDTENIIREIQKANIIILVFDITRPETFRRVTGFWLPLIGSSSKVPCILVGNKIDLPKSSQNLEEVGKGITEQFPLCQILIETTAKSYNSISKLFEIAEQSVLFPTAELFDPITYELTEDYIRAIKLIFRLCDEDGDMRLNNEELAKFNKDVFKIDLSAREIEKIKNMIRESTSDGVDHIGVTLSGFIAINKVFIKKLKSNNSWMILQHYNFDEQLERKIEILVNMEPGYVLEFSDFAIDFLVRLFKKYATHNVLTEGGIQEICSTMKSLPWYPKNFRDMVHCIDNGLSVYGWLSLWYLMMYKDPKHALTSLFSLGYPQSIVSAYTKIERSKLSQRKLHVCLVAGNEMVGKKHLLRKFLYKQADEPVLDTVCGSIEETEIVNKSTFLIMTKGEDEKKPDVVCMVYNGTAMSQSYIKKFTLDEKVPRILMLNKNDMLDHESAYSFALELGLRECPQFNLKSQRPGSLFKQLKDYAVDPTKGSIRRIKNRARPQEQNSLGKWIFAGIGVISIALLVGNRVIRK